MSTIHPSATANPTTRPLSADDHLAAVSPEQHHLAWSVFLHLAPGIALTAFVLLAGPVVEAWGFPSVFALFIGIPLVIVPVELGTLLVHAKRATGSFSLGRTVLYRERVPVRRLVPMTIGLFAWFAAFLVLATTVLDEWIATRFFGWVPDAILRFSAVDQAGESAPLAAVIVLIVVAVVFNGIVGPVTEELYFRGYLLPRIDRLGRWAPALNTVLFSLYHLWTPWQNLTRIIGLLPTVWLSWRKRSTQLAIAVHVTINLVFLLGLMALVIGSAA